MRKKVIIAVFLALVLEGILRIRYGVPPYEPDSFNFTEYYLNIYNAFFKKNHAKDRDTYIPQRIPTEAKAFFAPKAAHTVRIFIVGGSVAFGWDPVQLKECLSSITPDTGRDYEVINCGMGGYDSYRDYLVEKEILSYQPDLIVVLSGNNEGIYNSVKINVTAYHLNKLFRNAWVYRLVDDRFIAWCYEHRLLFFRDNRRRLIDYGNNLRRMAREARKKKVPIILCTLPYNLRDCPPEGARPAHKAYFLARFYLDNGQYADAINGFNDFLKNDPNNKLGIYFLGRAYDKLHDYPKARACYVQALELDCFNSRVNPRSNEMLRQVCIKEKAGLADLEKVFIDRAPHGLSGREQFRDPCHWWEDYYFLVSETVIKEIMKENTLRSRIFGEPGNKLFSYHLPSLEELGKIEGNAERNIEKVMWEIMTTTSENLHERWISYLETSYFLSQGSLKNIILLKGKIKELLFNDYTRHDFCVNNPHSFEQSWPLLLYYIGETYRRLGKFEESLTCFNEAISLDGNKDLPYLGRALVYYRLGDKQKSEDDIYRAEELSQRLETEYLKEILGL